MENESKSRNRRTATLESRDTETLHTKLCHETETEKKGINSMIRRDSESSIMEEEAFTENDCKQTVSENTKASGDTKRQYSSVFLSFLFPSSCRKKMNKTKTGVSDDMDSKVVNDTSNTSAIKLPIFLIVFLWYTLGVLSVSTSKILLTSHPSTADVSFFTVGGIGPLVLTLQQFILGAFMLFCLLRYEDIKGGYRVSETFSIKSIPKAQTPGEKNEALKELFLAGFFFSFGFVLTNFSFHGNDASFVETIKASEPISSAVVASMNGIEVFGYQEILSLMVIVFGVALSTIAKSSPKINSSTVNASFWTSLFSCILVSSSNLCFSFRGLHQKLFRKSHPQHSFDNRNFLFRMQQIGVGLVLLPVMIFEFPGGLRKLLQLINTLGLFQSGIFVRYLCLSILNAFAFVSYNLASTFILSRLTVVQHAALNALRRVFAVFVTSILFSVPITLLGFIGIVLSILGFFSFTHFKMKRKGSPEKKSNTILPTSS